MNVSKDKLKKAPIKPVALKGSNAKAKTAKTNTSKAEYFALQNIQRAKAANLKFFLFHAPASEIYKWGLVDRMSPENPKGMQRRLNKTKVLRIKEFLANSSHANTIATSVVVVFNEGAAKFLPLKSSSGKLIDGVGKLTISWSGVGTAGVIVDGQHRVIGAQAYGDEDIHLNVVGIFGADDNEGAFQFLVINNNSSKVNPNQVKAIFATYKEEELLQRMLDSGSTNVDAEKITALDYFDGGIDSPFKGQLNWEKNSGGFVVPNALEAGLMEVQNRSSLLSVQEFELDTFVVIWNVVKKLWPDLWDKESHLLEKASIQALTAFISENLENLLNFNEEEIDYTDPVDLENSVARILKNLEPTFFRVEWAKTGLDTRAGHELLVGDLKQIASNQRRKIPWHNGLETVRIATVSGGASGSQIKGTRPKKIKG